MKISEMEATSIYQRLKEQEEKLVQFLQPFLGRPELLRAALQYISGLSRKNTWQLAAATGFKSPYAFQHLLGRAVWDVEALRAHLQLVGIQEKEGAILVIGEEDFLKKGNQSAGVARQYNRTSRRWENAQVGLFLAYASGDQELLIDRELYIPPLWFEDSQRCKKSKIPDNLVYRTKPELAQAMLTRAFAHELKPAWVVGDQVYARNEFRSFLEQNQCAYLVGIPATYQVRIGLYSYQVSQVVERIGVWHSLLFEKGKKEEGYEEWQRVAINSTSPTDSESWLLLRKNIKEPKKVSYYLAFGRKETSLEELVKVAGRRETMQRCLQKSKTVWGLDQYQVRTYVGWYRHITLCLVGSLFLEEMSKSLNQVSQGKRIQASIQAFLSKWSLFQWVTGPKG